MHPDVLKTLLETDNILLSYLLRRFLKLNFGQTGIFISTESESRF